MEVTPSQTLYVNNINEKIKKDSLKKTLYALFSQYGKVIEIVACKGIRLRGQVRLLIMHLLTNLCSGMDSISRHQQCHQCHAPSARVQFLRQTTGKHNVIYLCYFILNFLYYRESRLRRKSRILSLKKMALSIHDKRECAKRRLQRSVVPQPLQLSKAQRPRPSRLLSQL